MAGLMKRVQWRGYQRMTLYSESINKTITVCYTSIKFSGDRRDVKNTLARELLNNVVPRFIIEKKEQLIANDIYGCPRVNSKYKQPLAISFSYSGQELWAAVADVAALGIDVAMAADFLAPYPYNRAFMEHELQLASSFGSNKEDAAALLWSCKEAAMKKRGTGFHFNDPRDVQILSCLLDGYGRYRVIVATPKKISVVVRKERHLWFAVAASE